MNIHAAAVLFVIGCTTPAIFSSDVTRRKRRSLHSKNTNPNTSTNNGDDACTKCATCQNTARNGRRLADLTDDQAALITDWHMHNLLDHIGPNADTGIVQDQKESDVTTLLNRTLADVVEGFRLGTEVDLPELRRLMDDGVTETRDADGQVRFTRHPVISISDGDVITGFTACVNGLSNLTSHATYVTMDNTVGLLYGIGGAASSTGATRYEDGSFSKGYAYSRGSDKLDPETNARTMEGEASFRGANNFWGTAFTGDTDTKGYAKFDGTGMMTEQGGYSQSKGEMIGGLFSFTGNTFSNGTTEFSVDADGMIGMTVLEGTASADGNLVSNLDGFTSSGSSGSAGFLMLDASGVGVRGGGYAQFSGSTTSPLWGDFTGDAVSSGTFQRNEDGSYTFAGFACLGLPEGCVLNQNGTYDSMACSDPEYFCVEGSITF